MDTPTSTKITDTESNRKVNKTYMSVELYELYKESIGDLTSDSS